MSFRRRIRSCANVDEENYHRLLRRVLENENGDTLNQFLVFDMRNRKIPLFTTVPQDAEFQLNALRKHVAQKQDDTLLLRFVTIGTSDVLMQRSLSNGMFTVTLYVPRAELLADIPSIVCFAGLLVQYISGITQVECDKLYVHITQSYIGEKNEKTARKILTRSPRNAPMLFIETADETLASARIIGYDPYDVVSVARSGRKQWGFPTVV